MKNLIKLNIILLASFIIFSIKSAAAERILPIPKPTVDKETKSKVERKKYIMTRKIAVVPAFRDEFLQPFNTVFDQLLGETFPDMSKEIGHDFFAKGAYPRVDVVDGDEAIYIEAEIPGLAKDDVSVDVKDNLLTISGRRKGLHENDKNTRYIVKELKRSQFSRSFT